MSRSLTPILDLDSYLAEGPSSPPEVRLWAAVVARALLDACGNWGKVTDQAKEWINADTEEEYSFSWCADALCSDKGPDLVREVRKHVEIGVAPNSKISRWQHQRLGRMSIGRDKKKVD